MEIYIDDPEQIIKICPYMEESFINLNLYNLISDGL